MIKLQISESENPKRNIRPLLQNQMEKQKRFILGQVVIKIIHNVIIKIEEFYIDRDTKKI